MSDVGKVDEKRYFPRTMVVEDHLRKGSKTKLVVDEIEFDVALQNEIFSKRWLVRK